MIETEKPRGDMRHSGVAHSGVSEVLHVPPKVRQVVTSRKVWAGVLGLVTTLVLWELGEIDGARAVEAMAWVVGVFIGAVALEDGMTRFFAALAGGTRRDAAGGAAREDEPAAGAAKL